MTTTYDPAHPRYTDEGDLRQELTRAYDICHGCRICFNLCPAFPSLFEMVDRRDGAVAELTEAEQDRVVEECYQCKLCALKCPYRPPHEWALDFPKLMLRAQAVRHRARRGRLAERLSEQALARTDLAGTVASAAAPLVNRLVTNPGTIARKAMEAVAGIAADRVLPPYARERFSTWARRRPPASGGEGQPQAEVSVFATCFVEYMEPGIGRDLVRVYERNNLACSLPAGARCCGAPYLHSGDIRSFAKAARHNVEVLHREVRAGRDVVVPQPTCGYVLKRDYPEHLGSPQAREVAARTYDASEYLMRLRREEGTSLHTDFPGEVPESVAYHTACHMRAQEMGYKGRDLLKLTGTRIELVSRCSGIDGTWGYRAKNHELSRQVARPLAEAIQELDSAVVCGDCHLANTAIAEETGRTPQHPLQVLARAYGIPEER